MTTPTEVYEVFKHLPFPRPAEHDGCEVCGGAGVLQEPQFESPAGEPRNGVQIMLVVDVLCPAYAAQLLARDDEDQEPAEDACPSCGGAKYWIAQGFSGDGQHTEEHMLAMPCGCAEKLMQTVPAPPEM